MGDFLVLELALKLGADGDSSPGGVHWIDHVCSGTNLQQVPGTVNAALLERNPTLTEARRACLAKHTQLAP